ncbi:MAG: DUF938 domain-containing protein [Sphingorhabdus sp.]
MTGPVPFVFGQTGETKRHAPATERNRDAIVEVLRTVLPVTGLVLEVASGTGQHVVHFARSFPALDWQPSDPDPAGLASIAAWRQESELPNLLPPVELDAAASWPVYTADAIACINMVHIAPWAATLGLLTGAARILPQGAPLYLYGPYRQHDVVTAPSNEQFDISLKSRNPEWGLRDVEDVTAAADAVGLKLESIVEMPANNLSLIFRRCVKAT